VPRLISRIAELAAQLDDHLVERARGAEVVVSPNLVEQAVAGEHLASMRVEQLQ